MEGPESAERAAGEESQPLREGIGQGRRSGALVKRRCGVDGDACTEKSSQGPDARTGAGKWSGATEGLRRRGWRCRRQAWGPGSRVEKVLLEAYLSQCL